MNRTIALTVAAVAVLTAGAGTALAVDLPEQAGKGQAPLHVPTTPRTPAVPDVAVPAQGDLLAGSAWKSSPLIRPTGSAWKSSPTGSRWASADGQLVVVAAGRSWASTDVQAPTFQHVRIKSEV